MGSGEDITGWTAGGDTVTHDQGHLGFFQPKVVPPPPYIGRQPGPLLSLNCSGVLARSNFLYEAAFNFPRGLLALVTFNSESVGPLDI